MARVCIAIWRAVRMMARLASCARGGNQVRHFLVDADIGEFHHARFRICIGMARLINQSMRPVISLDARYLHLLHGIGSIKLIFHHRLEPHHLALIWTTCGVLVVLALAMFWEMTSIRTFSA